MLPHEDAEPRPLLK
jgi:X-X-X-Leu-X-X-Gly heptad repeat protein